MGPLPLSIHIATKVIWLLKYRMTLQEIMLYTICKMEPAFIWFFDLVTIDVHAHVVSLQHVFGGGEGAVFIIIIENIESQATSFTTIPTPSPSKIF